MTTNNIILSYLGPQEIEANRAAVLVGSFDKNLVAAISAAEGSKTLYRHLEYQFRKRLR